MTAPRAPAATRAQMQQPPVHRCNSPAVTEAQLPHRHSKHTQAATGGQAAVLQPDSTQPDITQHLLQVGTKAHKKGLMLKLLSQAVQRSCWVCLESHNSQQIPSFPSANESASP
jgi:cell division septation protein DedD